MCRSRKGVYAVLMIASLATMAPILFAHGGGLDKYGCHNNRKVGNYHCHRGEFAGRTFANQAEMLKLLKEK